MGASMLVFFAAIGVLVSLMVSLPESRSGSCCLWSPSQDGVQEVAVVEVDNRVKGQLCRN